MPRKVAERPSSPPSLTPYNDAIKAHFILMFGEDPNNPGEPNHIPDSWYIITKDDVVFRVRMRENRVTGIADVQVHIPSTTPTRRRY